MSLELSVIRVLYNSICFNNKKGSSNIWINSNKCQDLGCVTHKQYQSELSTSFVKVGDHLDVQFGTGELIGEVNSDRVFLAGIQVENQKIAEITKEIGGVFVDVDFTPLLSYHKINSRNSKELLDLLIQQWPVLE